MIDWQNIKITVSKSKKKNFNPFDYDDVKFPSGNINIIIKSDKLDDALSDLFYRLFKSVDIELTDEVLKDIKRVTDKRFENQFLLIFKGNILGLVFVESDMFSTFLRFRSENKNFIEIN